jgi:threonine/homoserine/homoserine lactone efflux protein
MIGAIGEVLGLALGIAISPVPVAAVILMLFSERARANGSAFLAAWIVGIAAVTTVVSLIPGVGSDDGAPSTTSGWIKLALGALLLVAGIRQWTTRPRGDAPTAPPGWLTRIDELQPGAALGLGVVLSALNPKNLLLAAAAGVSIASSELTGGEAAVVIAVFTIVASATVGGPVVAYLTAGDRLDAPLDAAKSWLLDNDTAVMAVLFAVFGASLLGDGLEIVTAAR